MEKLHKLILAFLFKKHFVFRTRYYEIDAVITDTNVIEYEFVNVGRSSVFVNDMELIPVGLGVPVGSPTGNIFNRITLGINYNEVDTTIYRIKFPKPEPFICLEVCSGAMTLNFFPVCAGLPPTCEWLVTLFIGGIPITNPFNINCNTGATAMLWQDAVNNNLLPSFVGTIVVTFVATASPTNFDVVFTFTGIELPCEAGSPSPSIILQDITPPPPFPEPPILCPLFSFTTEPFVCIIPPPPPPFPIGKLLVISKCLAGLKDNP